MWDNELEGHWWRVIDFLSLVGQGGVILNQKKFQFCQKTVDFAGFRITASEINPLEKFIRAIKEFPTPKKLTDIRSWFGLINQVGYYDKLCHVMAPFKHLLSPKTCFVWNEELDTAFRRSKELIVNAIIESSTLSVALAYGPTGRRREWDFSCPEALLLSATISRLLSRRLENSTGGFPLFETRKRHDMPQ